MRQSPGRLEAFLRGVRQVGRAIVRQTDSQELIRQTVGYLTDAGGFSQARLVHWNVSQSLGAAAVGPAANLDNPELPACLRGRGSCQGCQLDRVKVASQTLVPLLYQQQCHGALLLEARDHLSEELELLVELGEDLGLALGRLEQRRTLLNRDQIRREVEKLGHIGGWEFDPVTGEGDWTEEVARIHDLDPASSIDKERGLNYYLPSSRPLIDQAVARCLEGGEGYDLELEISTAKGVHKWVRALGAPVIENGRVVRVRGLMQDITARKNAEVDLLRSQERTQALFDGAGIGLAESHAATGRYRRVNRKLCETLGYSNEEMLRKSWQELTHPDDLFQDELRRDEFQQGLMTQDNFEKRYLRKDGSYIWVRVTVSARLDDGCFITTVEDISQRHQAVQALREQKRRLGTIFDRILAGIMVVRLSDRVILEVNPGMKKLVGWSASEMVGRTSVQLNLFENERDVVRLREELARTGALQPVEIRVRRKCGASADFLLTGGLAEIAGEDCAIVLWHDLSELRRADAALRESENQLRVMFQMAPVGIANGDPVTRLFLDANDRFCAITGYSAEELKTMTVGQLSHPEDGPRCQQQFLDTVRANLNEYHTDKRYIRKDGSIAWVHVDVSILRDDQGLPRRTISVIEDIGQRQQAEARLREAEQRSRVALDAVGQGTMKRDLTTDLVELDARAQQHFELNQTVVPLRELFLRIHPEDRELARATAAQASDQAVYHCELRLLLPGGLRWLAIHGRSIHDAHGVAVAAVTTTLDISQAKEAEQALRASKERYQDLVDHLEDLVFSLDDRSRITFVNQSVARLGYQPEEVLGRHVARYLPAEDRRLLRSTPLPKEWRLLDRSGKVRWFRVNLGLQPDHKTVSGVAVDVTLQKATEEQLLAAQKMEAIGRLAGGVAHDFNNLLTVILSYTELAMEELPERDPVLLDLQEVMAAGDRAKGLTRQLLAFSRRQMMSPEVLDLNGLVGSVERMLTRLIGEDIQLEVELSENLCPVRADRSQLEQVLLNLAVNARDAMPGGGRLRLVTTNLNLSAERARSLEVEPGKYAHIWVQDSGSGMSEEVQSRIFEPFFTTKEAGKGTGLGLAMVYGIVRQSSGAIEVQSRPNEGSCFHIYLPASPEAPSLRTPLRRPATPQGGRETLLVVEDEPALLNLTRRTLNGAGYRVLCAANGGEALLLAEKEGSAIDLILSDVVMPGMNGPDLLVRLRPLCPKARFLLMSGYPNDVLAGRGVDEEEILAKPFDAPTLRAAIRSCLSEQR